MMKAIGIGGLAAALVLSSGVLIGALAQTQTPARTPAEQVEYRQSQMTVLRDNARTISRFLRDGQGAMADVVTAARAMNQVAQDIPALFPAGTAVGVGDSEALPVIWEDWPAFTETAGNARTAMAALLAAAESGDAEAVRTRFAAAGQACGSCHETYRHD